MKKEIGFSLIESGKLSNEQVIKICSDVKDKELWKMASRKIILEDCNKESLLNIEQNCEETSTTIKIISVGKLSEDELITIGKKRSNHEVWDAILQQMNFSGFADDAAVKFAKKTNASIIWIVTFHQIKLDEKTPDELFEFCKTANVKEIFLGALKLSKFSAEQLMTIGWLAKEDEVWRAVEEQIKLI